MITIEIFGPGCQRCHATMQAVQQAVRTLSLEATVTQINDLKEMAKHRIMFTPAVRINGEVKCTGRVPSVPEVTTWLASAAQVAEA